MPIDLNRGSGSMSLPTELSSIVLQKARDTSAIMQLATPISLPGRGLSIPTLTGDPEASWVDETDAKPVKVPSVGLKVMKAYTMAVIIPFSNQFRRDLPMLFDAIEGQLPGAFGKTFDKTCMGAMTKPGDNFDNFSTCTAQSLIASGSHTLYDGLVAADADIATHGGILNGFALGPQARGLILGSKDSDGRPIFINNVSEGAVPLILGARTVMGRGIYKAGSAAGASTSGTPAVVGIAGDWTQAMYGIVNGIEISFSSDATLTYTDELDQTVTINLFQRNMFALRCEFEVGFVCNASAFNRLLGAIPSA